MPFYLTKTVGQVENEITNSKSLLSIDQAIVIITNNNYENDNYSDYVLSGIFLILATIPRSVKKIAHQMIASF